MTYFQHIAPVHFEGADSDNPLAFRHYDPSRRVLGKPMAEHLRLASCYWHSFVWPGADMFGAGTFERPWQQAGEPMAQARAKANAAFDFFSRLGVPFYTFHDTDVE
jgi:xylose isomerase